MSRIDKDLAKIAQREWPSFAGSADLLLDGSGAYYYVNPATGKYRHADYLHARHVLGLDDSVMTEESDMNPDLEWLARNITEWPERYTYARRDSDFSNGVRWSFADKLDHGYGWITEPQWLQARQDLGLIMTPEEAEIPAREHRRTAESFLNNAARIMAERGKQYDQPGGERSMGKAVAALNAITGRDLTEAEGWLLLSLMKRVRQHSGAGYHQDSAEDAVAYAALEAEALEANHATS